MNEPLCGDPTCEDYGCTQDAIDAWHDRQEAAARDFVRSALGLPVGCDSLNEGFNDIERTRRTLAYDAGGLLPVVSQTFNASSEPEPVRTPEDDENWRAWLRKWGGS